MQNVKSLNDTVRKELKDLPDDMQAQFIYVCQLIDDFGVGQTNAPYTKYIKHLTKKL